MLVLYHPFFIMFMVAYWQAIMRKPGYMPKSVSNFYRLFPGVTSRCCLPFFEERDKLCVDIEIRERCIVVKNYFKCNNF